MGLNGLSPALPKSYRYKECSKTRNAVFAIPLIFRRLRRLWESPLISTSSSQVVEIQGRFWVMRVKSFTIGLPDKGAMVAAKQHNQQAEDDQCGKLRLGDYCEFAVMIEYGPNGCFAVI